MAPFRDVVKVKSECIAIVAGLLDAEGRVTWNREDDVIMEGCWAGYLEEALKNSFGWGEGHCWT